MTQHFVMSRTIEQKKNGDGFPKAGELIEFRSQKELTLQDRRILNLLVEHAGPNIVTEEEHRIPMTALRGTHKGGERVRDSIVRLMTTIVEVPTKDSNGKRATRRGNFLPIRRPQMTKRTRTARSVIVFRKPCVR